MAKWVSATPVGHQRDGLGDVSQEMDGRGGPEARAIMGPIRRDWFPNPACCGERLRDCSRYPSGLYRDHVLTGQKHT